MKSAFDRRPLNLRTIGVVIFEDAIARPSAKTMSFNLNLQRTSQDLHALRIPICVRVENVRASRVKAQR